eukprot:5865743-Pyramimonas_sp.AAC.1
MTAVGRSAAAPDHVQRFEQLRLETLQGRCGRGAHAFCTDGGAGSLHCRGASADPRNLRRASNMYS